jgi:hypothetical protein
MELDPQHRFQHRYILGKTGTGKSTTMLSLMLDDMEAGDGLFYIDPHGQDADLLLEHIPDTRKRDVILFDPSDIDNPAPINVLEHVAPEWVPFVASSIVDTFKSVWGYDQLSTPVLDQYLYNATAALLEMPGATLMHIKPMLTSSRFREQVLEHVTDPVIRDFWETDFAAMSPREQRETSRSTLNKIGLLMADPRIRNTFGYPKSAVDLPGVLDGKILIARLPQGRLGLQKTRILGAILLARLHAVALSRSDRTAFHIYLDECHHFGTGTLIEMLSGIRKFGVSLTLCHQYINQLTPPLRDAMLGTIGTKIVFRVGLADAEALKHEFPVNNLFWSVADLAPHTARISTPTTQYYEREMPTLPNERNSAMAEAIRRFSQRHHTRSRGRVEKQIEGGLDLGHRDLPARDQSS